MKLKRLLAIILSATVLLTTVQVCFAFLASAGSDPVYYVASSAYGGDDSNDGSDGHPFLTIKKAEQAIAALEASSNGSVNATIKVKGNVDFTSSEERDGMLTIEGADNQSSLNIHANHKIGTTSRNTVYYLLLKGDTTFKNINLLETYLSDTGASIAKTKFKAVLTNGYELVLDTNCTTQPTIWIGNIDENSTQKVESITVNNFGNSSNGLEIETNSSVSATKRVYGGINLTVNGGYVENINFAKASYIGDVNLVFNGITSTATGSVVTKGSTFEKFGAALQIVVNNGITTDVVGDLKDVTADGGKWIIYGAEKGGKVLTTEDAGKFKVEYDAGYTVAKAVKRTDVSKVVEADNNGIIDISGIENAGIYDVYFTKADIPNPPAEPTVINKIYYVDAVNGNDENDGLAIEKAFKTINRAQSAASNLEVQATNTVVNAVIYIKGDGLEFDGGLTHKGMFTIKGYNDTTASINYITEKKENSAGEELDYVVCKGPTTFDTVTLPSNAAAKYLASGGNELILKYITVDGDKTYNYAIGYADSTSNDTKEVVVADNIGSADGAENNIYFGAVSKNNTTSAGLDFTLNNGTLNKLGFLSGTTYNGDVNIVLNKFSKTTNKSTAEIDINSTFKGAFQFIVNNNKAVEFSAESLAKLEAVTADGGAWILYSNNPAGTLKTTNQKGKFEVVNTTWYAKAVNKANPELITYSDENKILELDAGVYEINYVPRLPSSDNNPPIVDNDEIISVEYFVDATNGDDNNNGLSPETAFKTIAKAQTMAASQEDSGKKVNATINITGGNFVFTDSVAHKGMFTIVGDGTTNNKLDVAADSGVQGYHTVLRGPTTFKNVYCHNTSAVITNGHEFILDMASPSDLKQDFMIGNTHHLSSVTDEKMTVNAFAGGFYNGGSYYIGSWGTGTTGGIDFVHNAGHLTRVRFATNTTFKGNVNLTFNDLTKRAASGQTTKIEIEGGTPVFEKALQVIFNNNVGTKFDSNALENVTAAEGKWFIYSEVGGLVSTTNYAGTFKVTDGMQAIATDRNDTDKVYKSDAGILDLPQGSYDISYIITGSLEKADPEPANRIDRTYFVNSATGNDETGDGSEANPFATINKAEAVAASEETADTAVDATIYVAGTVEFDGGVAHKGMFTIVGNGTKDSTVNVLAADQAATGMPASILKGNTTFKDVYFFRPTKADGSLSDSNGIITNGYKLVLDVKEPGNQKGIAMIGNTAQTDGYRRDKVTVNNLTGDLYTAATYTFGNFGTSATGGVDFIHNGGYFYQVHMRNGTSFMGDVNIVFNGMETRGDSSGAPIIRLEENSDVKFYKALQVVFNNGLASKFAYNHLENATARGGAWIMYGYKPTENDKFNVNGTLSTTDIAGKFTVTSDKTAWAVNKETYVIVKSVDGVLDLSAEPGKYDVYYRDTEPDIIKPDDPVNEEPNDATGTIKEYLVYVAPEEEGGSDRRGDGSKEKPYRTIDKAMWRIASIPKETGVIKSGIIVLSGTADFDGGEPHVNMITIRAANPTATLNLISSGSYDIIGNSTILQGPTTFDGLKIPKTVSVISANNHEVVVTGCSEGDANRDVKIYAGQVDTPIGSNADQNITVNGWSGVTWGGLNLYFGPIGNNVGKSVGNINAVINNGHFKTLRLLPGIYNGNVNFTWNGGTYTNDGPYNAMLEGYNSQTQQHIIKGAFQFIVNNGCGETPTTQYVDKYGNKHQTDEVLFTNVEADGGVWFMYGEKGGRLSMTETPGTFAVSSGRIATAVNRETGVSKKSENGLLTVPEGTYDVTFVEDIQSALYIDANAINTETVGQKVRLVNGKTYRMSFDYRNLENGLGNNVNVAVYSSSDNKVIYSSALSGDKNIKHIAEEVNTTTRTYEFTFTGTTGDYGVGFEINGSTLMRVFNLRLWDVSGNVNENLFKNSELKQSINNWNISNTSAETDAKQHSVTNGDAYVVIETGDYYASDYRIVSEDAQVLKVKSDGNMSIGTNVELKGGSTYKLIIDHKAVNADFYYDTATYIRPAFGTDSVIEYYKTVYHNIGATLPRVYKDKTYSTTVFEFTPNFDGIYGIGILVNDITQYKRLNETYELFFSNISIYDTAEPTVNLVNNSDFSDNLNGWYVSEHSTVSGKKTVVDYAIEADATSYKLTDTDEITLTEYTDDFFKFHKDDEEKGMLQVSNGAGWNNIYYVFREEDTLLPGHTYVYRVAVCTEYEPKLAIVHSGNRDGVFENSSIGPTEIEKVETEKYSYYIATYEFTMPEKDAKGNDISHEVFIGFSLTASQSLWIFDNHMYDKADPRKTNIMRNNDFSSGLDNWMLGWEGFTGRWLGYGRTEFKDEKTGSIVKVYPYNYNNLISYKDDSNVDDGQWWDPNSVIEPNSQPDVGYVSGTIVDSNGKPFSGVTVELISISNESIKFTAVTDANGFFEMKDVLAYTYYLYLIDADGNRYDTKKSLKSIGVTNLSAVTINLVVSPKKISGDVTVNTNRSTIKGTLYNAKREPLAGVTVGVAKNKRMVTDENGNFEFTELPAGKYRIYAVNPNGSYYLLRDYELGEGQIVSLRLKYDPNGKNKTDNTNNANVDNDNSSSLWLWIIIIAAAVLVIGSGTTILIILLKLKKKNAKA